MALRFFLCLLCPCFVGVCFLLVDLGSFAFFLFGFLSNFRIVVLIVVF